MLIKVIAWALYALLVVGLVSTQPAWVLPMLVGALGAYVAGFHRAQWGRALFESRRAIKSRNAWRD